MTAHARAALEGYAAVFAARTRWLTSGSDADKSRFDAAAVEYRARFDCSCESDSRLCECTYNPAPHADAAESSTVYRSDSGAQTMPKSYSDFLQQTNGDTREAERLFNQATFNSRRPPTVASSLHSDAADAEAKMRADHRTAWTAPLAASKETARDAQHRAALVGERLARSDAQAAELREHRATRVRLDATTPVAKRPVSRAWQAPLQATTQRSAGRHGTHWTDGNGDDGPKDAA